MSEIRGQAGAEAAGLGQKVPASVSLGFLKFVQRRYSVARLANADPTTKIVGITEDRDHHREPCSSGVTMLRPTSLNLGGCLEHTRKRWMAVR